MSSLKWHRRMKHEGLNQKGQRHNLDHFVEGARGVPYRPPSVLDVEQKTRKAELSDQWVGPATIVKKIGSRSFQISFFNPSTGTTQLLHRDAGMFILNKEWQAPSFDQLHFRVVPTRHQSGTKLQVGVMGIPVVREYPEPRIDIFVKLRVIASQCMDTSHQGVRYNVIGRRRRRRVQKL
jgi:hypothetical protein